MPYVDASNHNLSPTQKDYFVDSTTASLSTTLNRIAPLKKVITRRRVAPWYNSQSCSSKQGVRKMGRIWHSTCSHIAWKDSLITYEKKKISVRLEHSFKSCVLSNKGLCSHSVRGQRLARRRSKLLTTYLVLPWWQNMSKAAVNQFAIFLLPLIRLHLIYSSFVFNGTCGHACMHWGGTIIKALSTTYICIDGFVVPIWWHLLFSCLVNSRGLKSYYCTTLFKS